MAAMAKEAQENIWKNEMNLLRKNDELVLLESELKKLNEELAAKGKPPANAEQKQRFVLERNIEGKKREIAVLQDTKAYNAYLLTDLYPRYLNQ